MWSVSPINLELKYTWKISRNASDEKTNLIVTCSDHGIVAKGEAAPNVRYNETAEDGIRLFDAIKDLLDDAPDIQSVRAILKSHSIFNSLSFAIESAWFHFQAANSGRSIHE